MKKMLRQLILLLCLFAIMPSKAQNKKIEFDKFFCDSTLRVDYIFSGDAQSQQISLDKCNLMPHWYGKRNNLDILPVQGMVRLRCATITRSRLYTRTRSQHCFKNG